MFVIEKNIPMKGIQVCNSGLPKRKNTKAYCPCCQKVTIRKLRTTAEVVTMYCGCQEPAKGRRR